MTNDELTALAAAIVLTAGSVPEAALTSEVVGRPAPQEPDYNALAPWPKAEPGQSEQESFALHGRVNTERWALHRAHELEVARWHQTARCAWAIETARLLVAMVRKRSRCGGGAT